MIFFISLQVVHETRFALNEYSVPDRPDIQLSIDAENQNNRTGGEQQSREHG